MRCGKQKNGRPTSTTNNTQQCVRFLFLCSVAAIVRKKLLLCIRNLPLASSRIPCWLLPLVGGYYKYSRLYPWSLILRRVRLSTGVRCVRATLPRKNSCAGCAYASIPVLFGGAIILHDARNHVQSRTVLKGSRDDLENEPAVEEPELEM